MMLIAVDFANCQSCFNNQKVRSLRLFNSYLLRPHPQRRCEGRAEEVREGEPVNHLPTAVCTRSSRGAEVAPRVFLFWTHPLFLTSKWGCPHLRQYGAAISNSRFSKLQPAFPGAGRA